MLVFVVFYAAICEILFNCVAKCLTIICAKAKCFTSHILQIADVVADASACHLCLWNPCHPLDHATVCKQSIHVGAFHCPHWRCDGAERLSEKIVSIIANAPLDLARLCSRLDHTCQAVQILPIALARIQRQCMDFSNLSSAFASFVDTFKAKPLFTLLAVNILGLFAGLAMLVYVGFSDPEKIIDIADRFANRLTTTEQIIEPIPVPIPPEEEAKRLQESIPRDALTCAAVDEIGEEFAAERATFWTFSNGSYGLGGVPFNYANVHCPYVRDGIAYISEEFQKIPNSIAAETNAVLFPSPGVTGCGYWTKADISSAYIRASMKNLGTNAMLQCGVRDGRGIPIGKITVSWHDIDPARDIAALTVRLRATADAIGHYNTPTISIENLSTP